MIVVLEIARIAFQIGDITMQDLTYLMHVHQQTQINVILKQVEKMDYVNQL